MNYNKVTIIGRLVRDPEVKTIPSGQAVASVSVATSRQWKDKNTGAKKEQTEFHNVISFGKQAEIIGQYLKKGQEIMVTGRLQTRSWEKDGHKNYRTEIISEEMQMGPRVQVASTPPNPVKPVADTSEEEVRLEDIPF